MTKLIEIDARGWPVVDRQDDGEESEFHREQYLVDTFDDIIKILINLHGQLVGCHKR